MNILIVSESFIVREYMEQLFKEVLDYSTITIKNTSLPNSAPLILKGLKNNECVTIDNLLCTVMNEDGENRFSTCNRVWLKLKRMENTIEISGSCKVKIKCEFPVMR